MKCCFFFQVKMAKKSSVIVIRFQSVWSIIPFFQSDPFLKVVHILKHTYSIGFHYFTFLSLFSLLLHFFSSVTFVHQFHDLFLDISRCCFLCGFEFYSFCFSVTFFRFNKSSFDSMVFHVNPIESKHFCTK